VFASKGDYNTKIIYNENLEVAKEFEAHGIEYLHLVDLDGAKSSQIIKYYATQTTLKIDFGGGLKSDADLKIAFDSAPIKLQAAALLSRTELYSKMDSRIRF
jgi:phosphoribosylformimino-5-aminoimidazole carboxamide ribotide isomerase